MLLYSIFKSMRHFHEKVGTLRERTGTGNVVSLVTVDRDGLVFGSCGSCQLRSMALSACLNCTFTPLQAYIHGNFLRSSNVEFRHAVGASCSPRHGGLDSGRLTARRCSSKGYQSNRVAGVSGRGGVVAEVGKQELGYDVPVRHGVISGVNLMVSLLAATILTTCPPALSADSANTICSLKGVQANGYQYAYPESWVRDEIRGIEVLVHDPVVSELNMSIFTSPVQSGTLSGSAEEFGQAIITQYQKSPTIDKAELLGVDLKQDGSSNRTYSIELSIEAGGKPRHFLTKLIRTDRKVLSLALQVPEELWATNGSCMKSITDNFKQTALL